MNKRRDFLKHSGLLLSTLAIAPSLAFSSKKKAIGLQLWTLRDSLPKDIKGVLNQVAKTGFTELETFGYSAKENTFFGTSVQEFKAILDANGLKATSNHFDFNSFIKGNTNDLSAYIKTAQLLESEYVVVPWILPELRGTSADDYKKLAATLTTIAQQCKTAGLKLAYHNHDFEFTKFGNTTGYEILLNETDSHLVHFELDLYWAVRAGYNPLDLFAQHQGRFCLWHVKDMDNANKDWNTEVGKGAIDFKAIFAQAKQSGMKRFFLEHETNYNPNPLASIQTSFDYIAKNLM
jgi:sugar phosphate isomerase/epimerase